jgi:hypothetical protein
MDAIVVRQFSIVFAKGVQAMLNSQHWHVNKDEALVLEQGTGDFDMARGYYDPDENEVLVLLEALNPATRQPDPYIEGIVVALLNEHWHAARIRTEVV